MTDKSHFVFTNPLVSMIAVLHRQWWETVFVVVEPETVEGDVDDHALLAPQRHVRRQAPPGQHAIVRTTDDAQREA